MVKSMFAAVSGLRAHQTKMDVIGNNIANVNTYGFKKSRVVFKDVYYQTLNGASANSGANGGTNASQVGYGTQVGTIDVMFGTASGAPTDNITDMMIQGDGFFIVGPSDGANPPAPLSTDVDKLDSLNLTRVGNFKFDSKGYLVDGNGNYVYGVSNDGKALTLIQYDPATQGDITNIQVGKDGIITGSISTGPVTLGQVAVAKVGNPEGLTATEGGYWKTSPNSGAAVANKPDSGGAGAIKAGYLEMANVDLAQEFTDMITTQRGFQANSRIITVTDEMLQELVNLKR